MQTVALYRRRAEECEEIAKQAISEAHRQSILEIARSWRALADQREYMLKDWSTSERPQTKAGYEPTQH
jgi:hypothetical protein